MYEMTGSRRRDRSSCSAPVGRRARWWWRCLTTARGEIRLLNRTRERAQELARIEPAKVKAEDWDRRNEAPEGAALLVNTTSQGMVGYPPLDVSLDALPKAATVCDIVYNPLETPLLAAARKRGNTAIDGLGMLLHQAVPAFEAFYGVRPTVSNELRRAVENTL